MRQAAPCTTSADRHPRPVLNKPGRLDAEEWANHADPCPHRLRDARQIGQRILQLAAVIAHEHHERWDGQGYPRGLAGEQIQSGRPLRRPGRCADALASQRCYKNAWPSTRRWTMSAAVPARSFDPSWCGCCRQSGRRARGLPAPSG